MSTVSGTIINHAIALGTPGYYSPLTISPAGYVSNDGSPAIIGYTNGDSVLNQGTIVSGHGGIALYASGSVTNSGTITITGAAHDDVGVYFGGGTTGSVSNSGTISGGYAGVAIYNGTVTNTGTIAAANTHVSGNGYGDAGVRVIGSATISNTGTGLISGYVDGIYAVGGSTLVVTNSGTIEATAAATPFGSYGIFALGGLTVTNTGVMLARKYVIDGHGNNNTVINTGTIGGGVAGVIFFGGGTVTNNGGTITGYEGVVFSNFGTVTNSGTIAGTFNLSGIILNGGGYVSNASAGLISGVSAGVTVSGAAGTIVNAATISGATGLAFGNFANTVIDSGTIVGTGGTAIAFGAGDDLLQFQPADSIKIQGTVDGGGGANTLEFASAASTGTLTGVGANFVNFGTMVIDSGASWVFAGTDSFAQNVSLVDKGTLTIAGTVTANIYGSPGAAPLTVTATGDVSNGGTGAAIYFNSGSVTNLGTISATGSAPVDAGIRFRGTGRVDNQGTISGHYGILGYGAVTVTNTGSIDGGRDGLFLRGGGSVNNSGVITGTEAIAGPALALGVTINNSGTIAGSVGIGLSAGNTIASTIIDSGKITGSGGPAVQFDAGDDLMKFLPSTSIFIQGRVDGGGGTNTLEFASASGVGTLTGGGVYFAYFANGTIDAGAQWVFAGRDTIGVTTTIVDSGTLTVTGTLTNDGSINGVTYGALRIGTGGYLRNDATGVITRGTVGATLFNAAVLGVGYGTLVNDGTIRNSNGDVAVYLKSGGTVTNGATNATAALISARVGVYIHGTARVSNFGTISGYTGLDLYNGGTVTNGASNSTAALVSASQYGVVLDDTSTFTNFGTVIGSTQFGVRLQSGGSVANYGRVSGREGIVAENGHATITNSGTIVGTGGDGVQLVAAGTVIDSGTITGSGTAISFGGTGSNLLVLEHGYDLNGIVAGSASATNTVELLGTSSANAVTAIYSDLSLTNFGTVAFAPGDGNYATLTITNDAALPGTLTGFTGIHDTIDLTALSDAGNNAVTSFNSATDRLTVTAGTNSVTLQLGSGSYSGIHWRAQNDGHGGTEVFVSALQTSFLVHNETELNAAFAAIKSGGAESAANTDYTITFANSFALNTAVSSLTLASGDTLTIDGAGFTLDGGGVAHNFLNYAGPLTIKNLTIVNAVASVPTGADWTLTASKVGTGATLINAGTLSNSGTVFDYGALTNHALLNGSGILEVRTGGALANDGSITGVVLGVGGGALTNGASGQIGSFVDLTFGGTVTNYGTISTDLHIDGTGQVANLGTAAVISGSAYGLYLSSTAVGIITNEGTIHGGNAGIFSLYNDMVVTNESSGTISGARGIVGSLPSTVTNAGSIVGTGGTAVQFAGYNDRLIVDPGAVFVGRVDGGGGSNTLELAVGAHAGTLTGLYTQFTNFATETVDAGASWVLAGNNTIGSGQTLTNAGMLTNTGSLLVVGTLVDQSTLENSGSITPFAASNLVRLTAGATLINDAGGVINGGTGTPVYGVAGGTATVVNLGTIEAPFDAVSGVYLKGGGRITNGSSSATDALILGSANGILLGAAGTVANAGTVMGTAYGIVVDGNGSVTNSAGGVIVGNVSVNGNGTVINQGSISGHALGIAVYGTAAVINSGYVFGTTVAIGILLGSVTNSAGGVITGGEAGVLGLGIDTVSNFGTIQPLAPAGLGVDLFGGGTVIDGGTISGGTAVNFGGTSANLLVLEHGYHIGGQIVGSGSATNTLELLGNGAANSVTVDYNGLTLTNFGTVAFAAGASNFATLKITDTTALPGTITGFTGAHDVIDLTQLSDAGNDATYSFNASTHMLTVHGDNGTVQLHLGNGAYSGGFALTNDGHGGTKITAGAAPTVTSVTASGPGITGGTGDLKAGKVVTLTVKLDQAVTVDTTGGTPTLQLSGGGTATYVRGSGTGTLVFTYTVATGQNTADLTMTGFNFNGGTILNGVGAAANLTGAVTNPAGVLQIDTTPPTVTPVTATALEDSAATPIGITVSEAGLIVKITGLPDDGTVFLADRKTKVTIGQSLTVAQLEGLTFQPTLNEHDRSSTLTYTLTDAAGNTTTARATLKIDVDNGLVYVTPGTLAGKTYDGGGDHKLIVQGSGAADLAGVKGFTEIVLTGALSVSLDNSAFTGVTPPVLVVTAQSARSTIDLTGVTGPADRVLVNVAAGAVGTDTITAGGGNDALLISGAGRAGLTKVTGIGNIDLKGAISIALADSNFAGVPSGRIAVTAKAGHVVINDSAVKKAADGVVISVDAPDLASDTITGSTSGNDVLHVLGSGTVGLAGVTGVGNMFFSASETIRFVDANFTGVTGGRIFATLGAGGVTLDGSAIDKSGDSLLVSVKAANLAADTLKGGAGSDVLQITGPGTTLNLSKVSGFDYVTVAAGSSGNAMTLGNGNFADTSGLIVVTDLGSGNRINGAAIGAGANRNLIIHGASGDTLTGGGGTNFLVAGAGLETLIGGTGDTGFALTSATGKATIQRFTATDDQLVFSDAAFNLGADEGQGGASPQQLAASVFSSATNGTFANAQNRFAYNAGTGVLYYSADGKNADKVSVAVLSGHPTLKSQDLYFLA